MFRRAAILAMVVVASLSVGIRAAAQPSDPPPTVTFSTLRSVIAIPSGASSTLGAITIQATGSRVAELQGAPVLADSETPPDVIFTDILELRVGDIHRRVWRAAVIIKGVPANTVTVVRKATVTWAGATGTVNYQITSAAQPALNWKVTGLPSEWSVADGWCQPAGIVSSGPRATGIQLLPALVEQSSKEMLSGFYLSLDRATRASPSDLETALNDTFAPIYVCLDASSLTPGKYVGTMNIAANEKPEGDARTVTVYATTTAAAAMGGLILAIGCVASYLLRVLAPARISQSQALLGASLLDEQVRRLLADLGTIHAPVTRTELTRLSTDLQKDSLIRANLIIGNVPLPFGPGPDTAKFKERLDATAAQLLRLPIIVRGLRKATDLGGPQLGAALQAIDAIAATASTLTPAQVGTQVDAQVATLLPAPAPGPGMPAAPPLVDSQHLLLHLQQVSVISWVVWALLTWIAGYIILVRSMPGFGVPLDYLYCLLFALGVSATGQSLTSGTVNTALGITLPGARS